MAPAQSFLRKHASPCFFRSSARARKDALASTGGGGGGTSLPPDTPRASDAEGAAVALAGARDDRRTATASTKCGTASRRISSLFTFFPSTTSSSVDAARGAAGFLSFHSFAQYSTSFVTGSSSHFVGTYGGGHRDDATREGDAGGRAVMLKAPADASST